MEYLTFHKGQPSYMVKNDYVTVTATIQNGCVMPYFRLDDDREICPYWLAPWWSDRLYDDGSTISSTLRGNFFCMERKGVTAYEHGLCANSPWEYLGTVNRDDSSTLMMHFSDPTDGGSIRKSLRIHTGETVVYETDELSGFEGEFTYNTHPCLKLPKACKAGQLIGTFAGARTCADVTKPEDSAYRQLPILHEFKNLHDGFTVFGEKTDLTRHPQRKGTIDLLMARTEPENGLGYALFLNPEEGYIYYQLKNAAALPYTMLWLFNGGRHFAPWNGTQDGCLGVEEMSGDLFIFDEAFPSMENQKTVSLTKERQISVKQIYGIAPLPDSFEYIQSAKLMGDGLMLKSENGQKLKMPLELSFLHD